MAVVEIGFLFEGAADEAEETTDDDLEFSEAVVVATLENNLEPGAMMRLEVLGANGALAVVCGFLIRAAVCGAGLLAGAGNDEVLL